MDFKFVTQGLYVVLTASCTSGSQEIAKEKLNLPAAQQNKVQVQVLRKADFQRHLVSNGKLRALRKSDLKFNVPGEIRQLTIRNGHKIKAGEVIAQLEQFEYKQRLQNATTAFEKARLDLQDILIGQGYDLADSTKIPSVLLKTAAIRSGYITARGNLEDAKFKLKSSAIKAPFPGIVGNLKQKLYETVNTNEIFCVVIDDSKFEVEFQLVESEIRDVKVGDPVTITPYASDKEHKGKITEINPVIDDHGLIIVKAVTDNPGELLEGTNVKVVVERMIPGQLVVPKLAIVLRQNQEVLFKYVNGKATWTYVKTGLENSDSYTVVAQQEKGGSLQPGDTIIISGNLNLAHESEVYIE